MRASLRTIVLRFEKKLGHRIIRIRINEQVKLLLKAFNITECISVFLYYGTLPDILSLPCAC